MTASQHPNKISAIDLKDSQIAKENMLTNGYNGTRLKQQESIYSIKSDDDNNDPQTIIIEKLLIEEIRDENEKVLYTIYKNENIDYQSNSVGDVENKMTTTSNISKNSMQKSYLKQYLEKISRKPLNEFNLNNTSANSVTSALSSTSREGLENKFNYRFFPYKPRLLPRWQY